MIRVVYTWKVEPAQLRPFIASWKLTTNKIHEEVQGARGSFMIQNDKDPTEVKTVARWDSVKDWQKFWNEGRHQQMQSMHELVERVSVEVYTEIDDFTK